MDFDRLRELARHDIVFDALVIAAAVIIGLILHKLIFAVVRRWADRTDTALDDAVVRHERRPIRLLLVLVVLRMSYPVLVMTDSLRAFLERLHAIVLILGVAWMLLAALRVVEDYLHSRFDVEAKDNLRARSVHTQVRTFKNILTFGIVVLATGSILMTFEQVRQLGVSLLASAGVAGIVIGFAAQRSIATIVAGIQIAITQPIRLEDVVIVEGEWGWIEEIALSYVVVRVWDLRRVVLPITYFIEKPFQNWTRTESRILGTVFLYADYTVEVEAVREELHRVLKGTDLWDGDVWNLQVTDCTERTMTLRALMSAQDSGTAWNLRCHVREKLIDYLQRQQPAHLPRLRNTLEAMPEQPALEPRSA